MIAASTAKGRRVALFGLGGSGLATARALHAAGADLICHDDNPQKVEEARAEGIPTGDLRETDFSKVGELVLSPGVPLTHPAPHWTVALARKHNVPVIGDIELFCRERRAKAPDNPFIAITGTNGKSTTTALIAHVFANAGRDVQMGGNIGRAVLSLDEPGPGKVYVVECSSYQIDLTPSIDPDAGILLNLAPDHLDRHGTMENYAAIKARLVAAAGHAIIGNDDVHCTAIADALERQGRRVSRIASGKRLAEGVHARAGQLIEATRGEERVLFELAHAPALAGEHNAQNAAAAWLACREGGLDDGEIAAGLASFPGLAHRMERVGHLGGVLFINDSKATNADAAARALASFDAIHWIAGGLAKEGGIDSLKPYFAKVRKAYLVGEAAPEFAATIGASAPFEISGTIAQAVASAAADASRSDEGVVLLSPACASFDQFANFEKRGDAFREAVRALGGFIPAGEETP